MRPWIVAAVVLSVCGRSDLSTTELNRELDAFKKMMEADPDARNSLGSVTRPCQTAANGAPITFVLLWPRPDRAVIKCLPGTPDEDYVVFAVRCRCGGDQFSVHARVCRLSQVRVRMRETLTVYDIRCYPAGTPGRNASAPHQVFAPTERQSMD